MSGYATSASNPARQRIQYHQAGVYHLDAYAVAFITAIRNSPLTLMVVSISVASIAWQRPRVTANHRLRGTDKQAVWSITVAAPAIDPASAGRDNVPTNQSVFA